MKRFSVILGAIIFVMIMGKVVLGALGPDHRHSVKQVYQLCADANFDMQRARDALTGAGWREGSESEEQARWRESVAIAWRSEMSKVNFPDDLALTLEVTRSNPTRGTAQEHVNRVMNTKLLFGARKDSDGVVYRERASFIRGQDRLGVSYQKFDNGPSFLCEFNGSVSDNMDVIEAMLLRYDVDTINEFMAGPSRSIKGLALPFGDVPINIYILTPHGKQRFRTLPIRADLYMSVGFRRKGATND